MKLKKQLLSAIGVLTTFSSPFIIASCSNQKQDVPNSTTKPVNSIKKEIIEFITIDGREITPTVNDTQKNVLEISFNKKENYSFELKLDDKYVHSIFGNLGFTNPTITYKMEQSDNFSISKEGLIKSKNSLDYREKQWTINVYGTISEDNFDSQDFQIIILLNNEYNETGIIDTKPATNISKNVFESVKVNGFSSENISAKGNNSFDILFSSQNDYSIEITLNETYSTDVFGILGFNSPTIEYSSLTSGFVIQKLNGKTVLKSSVAQSLDKTLQIQGTIKEANYESQVFILTVQLINTYKPIDNKPILNIDYTLSPKTPEGKESDPQYWIVNPYTENYELIEEWGNAPLPMKEVITEEDLRDYFYYSIVKDYNIQVSFGKRNIDLQFFIDTYVKWLIENWNYFPWITFQNPPINFRPDLDKSLTWETLRDNRDDLKGYFEKNRWTIKETKLYNQAEAITWPSKFRDDFIQGLRIFLSNYVRPGMSDMDIAFAVFQFVSVYINYGGSKFYEYAVWTNHEGVCIHYAMIAAQLLNMMGIPAIPNVAAHLPGTIVGNPAATAEEHAVTWVYLDPKGGTDKKWYLMDATWGDINRKDVAWPNITVKKHNINTWDWFLEPILNKPWGEGLEYYPQQNSYFQFFYGPWPTLYQNESIMISDNGNYKNEWGTYNNIYTAFYGEAKEMSRPLYHNGSWYILIKDQYNRTKFYKTSLNSSQKELVEIPTKFAEYLKFNSYDGPAAAQYRDWVVLFNNPVPTKNYEPDANAKDRTLVFHNLNDAKWTQSFTWKLPNELLYVDSHNQEWTTNSSKLLTLFIDNETMIVQYEVNVDSKRQVFEKRYSLSEIKNDQQVSILEIKNDPFLSDGDVELAKIFFKYLGNTHKIGNNNYQTTKEEKEEWNRYFNTFKPTSDKHYENIMIIVNKYKEFEKSLIRSNSFLQSTVPNDLYATSIDNLKNYGFALDLNSGYNSFDKLSNGETDTSFKYDIYFSNKTQPSKNDFVLIASNLFETKLEYSMFAHKGFSEPNGYMYMIIHNDDYSISQETRIFRFSTVLEQEIPPVNQPKVMYFDGNKYIDIFSQTNYVRKIPDWFNKKWALAIDFTNTNPSKYKIKLFLKFYSFETQKLNTLFTSKIIDNPYKYHEEVPIGTIGQQNKGIYFIEAHSISVSNEQDVIKSYSRFVYLLSKEDIDQNNFDSWVDLSQKLVGSMNSVTSKEEDKFRTKK